MTFPPSECSCLNAVSKLYSYENSSLLHFFCKCLKTQNKTFYLGHFVTNIAEVAKANYSKLLNLSGFLKE